MMSLNCLRAHRPETSESQRTNGPDGCAAISRSPIFTLEFLPTFQCLSLLILVVDS
jgi:hypothetical protein